MNLLSKAPNVVIVICITMLLAVTIGSITVLVALGRNPHDVISFIMVLLNAAGLLLGSGAFLYSASAAKSSSQASEQLNGGLTQRIEAAVQNHIDTAHTENTNVV